MKASLTWKEYQHLEFDSQQQASSRFSPQSILSALRSHWHHLRATLLATEPQVWLSTTRSGQPQWNAYYPANGHLAQFSSEAEVRTWLEEQYYQ